MIFLLYVHYTFQKCNQKKEEYINIYSKLKSFRSKKILKLFIRIFFDLKLFFKKFK